MRIVKKPSKPLVVQEVKKIIPEEKVEIKTIPEIKEEKKISPSPALKKRTVAKRSKIEPKPIVKIENQVEEIINTREEISKDNDILLEEEILDDNKKEIITFED